MWYPLTLVFIYGPATLADYFVSTIPASLYNVIMFIYPINGIANTILYLYVRKVNVNTIPSDDGLSLPESKPARPGADDSLDSGENYLL